MGIDLQKHKNKGAQNNELLKLKEDYNSKLLLFQKAQDAILSALKHKNTSWLELEKIFKQLDTLKLPDIIIRDASCLAKRTNQKSYDALLNYDIKPFYDYIQEKRNSTDKIYHNYYPNNKCVYGIRYDSKDDTGLDTLTYEKLKEKELPKEILEIEKIFKSEAREFISVLSDLRIFNELVKYMKNLHKDIQSMDTRDEKEKTNARVDTATIEIITNHSKKIITTITDTLWRAFGFPTKTKDPVEDKKPETLKTKDSREDKKPEVPKAEPSFFDKLRSLDFSNILSSKTQAETTETQAETTKTQAETTETQAGGTNVTIYLDPKNHLPNTEKTQEDTDIETKVLNHTAAINKVHTNNQAILISMWASSKTECFSIPIAMSRKHTEMCTEDRLKEVEKSTAEYYTSKDKTQQFSSDLVIGTAQPSSALVTTQNNAIALTEKQKSVAEKCEEIKVKIEQHLENCNYIYAEDSTVDQYIQGLIEKSVENEIIERNGETFIKVDGLAISLTSNVAEFNETDVENIIHKAETNLASTLADGSANILQIAGGDSSSNTPALAYNSEL